MGMILTLYLISANVYNSVDTSESMGFSYIDIWMLGTNFPILFGLCEYGFILYLKKVAKKSDLDHNQMMNNNNTEVSNSDFDDNIKKLDFAAMIFSFSSFITFAALYWIILGM